MTHNEVFKKFKEYFNVEDSDIDVWFQNGKNSIRVRNKEKREFVFTYESERNWCLDTSEHFLENLEKNLKGVRK